MPDLRRVEVEWTTGIGGTGLSVFYTVEPADATADLGTFFNAIKGLFPISVTWTIPSSGDLIDSATGTLTGTWTGGTAASVAATGGLNPYAAGTGTYVRWATNTIVSGRRLQGRTFLCPILTSIYDSDGTLQPAHVTTIQNAANALVTAGDIFIWHRPSPGGSDGTGGIVTAGQARDRVTSLRSRRS